MLPEQDCSGSAAYFECVPAVALRSSKVKRKLQTKAGEVKLRIPKLRTQTFETAIIERYRRRESSIEEALIEMYLAGNQNAADLPGF